MSIVAMREVPVNYYNAPCGKSLKIITILASLLLIAGSIKHFLDSSGNEKYSNLIGLLLIILLFGCSLFAIRGYSITLERPKEFLSYLDIKRR
ncbi:MAG: hypothetical protein OEZ13_06780 [Spirochaetia bacterium]|nr:hypothetical protein [Spirochaetia bacterium]